jgi:hypothetical protein
MRYLIALLLATSAHASEGLIAEAKAHIGRNLKDPYSAVYEVYMGKAANGEPVVCGTVNAKNSYGAYGGRKRFYYLRQSGQIEDGGSSTVLIDALCGKNTR